MNKVNGTSPNFKKVAIALVLTTALTGCTINRSLRGYVSDAELVSAITPGIDNLTSVKDTLGNPTMTGTFDRSVWYYIATNTEQKSFFHEKPTHHMVMVVRFDETGVVDNIEHLGIEDMESVRAVADSTPTRGKELGFWEQIFGNVGRFAAAPGQGGATGPGGPR